MNNKTGMELISAEVEKHVKVEGWTPEHNDLHRRGELLSAASCYVNNALSWVQTHANNTDLLSEYERYSVMASLWPWDAKCWKPKSVIDDLVMAGALIVEEIERLQRIEKGGE